MAAECAVSTPPPSSRYWAIGSPRSDSRALSTSGKVSISSSGRARGQSWRPESRRECLWTRSPPSTREEVPGCFRIRCPAGRNGPGGVTRFVSSCGLCDTLAVRRAETRNLHPPSATSSVRRRWASCTNAAVSVLPFRQRGSSTTAHGFSRRVISRPRTATTTSPWWTPASPAARLQSICRSRPSRRTDSRIKSSRTGDFGRTIQSCSAS